MARNAIRLAALMRIGTIFVMTHDSIGLGEDGPTHQPIEHLASLRAIPGLNVFRPADTVETLECWEIAVRNRTAPSLLALSRQGVPQLRAEGDENLSAKGAYVIRPCGEARDITLIATGTEVSLAVEAAEALAADGIAAAVVSMPSWELFDAQTRGYRDETLGTAPRIAVEAAGKFGWTRYVAGEDDVIGMDGFGPPRRPRFCTRSSASPKRPSSPAPRCCSAEERRRDGASRVRRAGRAGDGRPAAAGRCRQQCADGCDAPRPLGRRR